MLYNVPPSAAHCVPVCRTNDAAHLNLTHTCSGEAQRTSALMLYSVPSSAAHCVPVCRTNDASHLNLTHTCSGEAQRTSALMLNNVPSSAAKFVPAWKTTNSSLTARPVLHNSPHYLNKCVLFSSAHTLKRSGFWCPSFYSLFVLWSYLEID